jgi:hypothetical protein
MNKRLDKRRANVRQHYCTKDESVRIVIQALKDKNKELEEINFERLETIRKLVRPFIGNISDATYKKILDGKFEAKVRVDDYGYMDPFNVRLGYFIEVPREEIR